jgi:hypothetical protein
VDIQKRIETVRIALHLNHGEIAKELGVSRAMYYCVKNGEKPFGNKAQRELERLEDVVFRSKGREARIMGASADATTQQDFENLLMARSERDIANNKLNKAKRELLQLRKRIDHILNELEET